MNLTSAEKKYFREIIDRLLFPRFQRTFEWIETTIVAFFDSIVDAYTNRDPSSPRNELGLGTFITGTPNEFGRGNGLKSIVIDAKQRIITCILFMGAYVRRTKSEKAIEAVEGVIFSNIYGQRFCNFSYENEDDIESIFLTKLFDFTTIGKKFFDALMEKEVICSIYKKIDNYIKKNPEKSDLIFDIMVGHVPEFKLTATLEHWEGTMEEFRKKYYSLNRIRQDHTTYQKIRNDLTEAYSCYDKMLDRFDLLFDNIKSRIGTKVEAEDKMNSFVMHCLFCTAEEIGLSFSESYKKEYSEKRVRSVLIDNNKTEAIKIFFQKYFTVSYYEYYRDHYLNFKDWVFSTQVGSKNSDLHASMMFLQSLIDDNNPNQQVAVTLAIKKLVDECFDGDKCINTKLFRMAFEEGVPAIYANLFRVEYGKANTIHKTLSHIIQNGWAMGVESLKLNKTDSLDMLHRIKVLTYKDHKPLLNKALALVETRNSDNWQEDLCTILSAKKELDHIVEQRTVKACSNSQMYGNPDLKEYTSIYDTIANLRLAAPIKNADAKALEHEELKSYKDMTQRRIEKCESVVTHPFFAKCVDYEIEK